MSSRILRLLVCTFILIPCIAFAAVDITDISPYSGEPYCILNDNIPFFSTDELAIGEFEEYSPLDALGRCSVACAVVSVDTMLSVPRGQIGMIKPSGWHTVRYDDLINDRYLNNRCHLIGYQLTGHNANESNLITGTRHMIIKGMLPTENYVANYIKEPESSVLYRVSPIFDGENLLANGVQIEAESIDDDGAGLIFNVYCYNVQPGIEIDYATGGSEPLSER